MHQEMKRGFTLVEIMVAVSIFAIVAVIAISALVTANNLNKQAQAIKLTIDNLDFALASMTLKMKQGGRYYCLEDDPWGATGAPTYPDPTSPLGQDCTDGGVAISFEQDTATPKQRFIYRFRESDKTGGLRLEYSHGDEDSSMSAFAPVTSPEVQIKSGRFIVMGAADTTLSRSPRVMVSIYGLATAGRQSSDFAVQTTIADRR
jgi:prepilin-type N-terminal cleavage/methylation domain-containing protein